VGLHPEIEEPQAKWISSGDRPYSVVFDRSAEFQLQSSATHSSEQSHDRHPNYRLFRTTDLQIGYEISFTRYFYKPKPMRTLEEIRRDIEALEKETEGLLDEVLVEVKS